MSDVGKDSTRIKKVVVKSYHLRELAAIYDKTVYRMRKSLRPHKIRIGNKEGYYYTIEQVTLIFRLVQLPSNVELVKA